MKERKEISLSEAIRTFYDKNPFVQHLDMQIDYISDGKTRLVMMVDEAKHTNFYGVAHGGALASLADTAMGSACLSVGKKVVTIEMNFNCIKPAPAGRNIVAEASILHNGSKTIIAEAEIRGEDGTLLVKARGSFFVIGQLTD
ncbi:MAG: PaaI family thioesterase [Selenomonadales bacterium]|nr:PaaI family thioesterase [Selenomonadales bacterium]